MSEKDDLGSFFRDNKDLLKEYIETRLDIFRLGAIRTISKSAGNFVWVIISLFLLFLIVLFAGLVLGFWLSDLTGSFIKGFGFTTLILLLLFSVLAVFRKKWFVNPLIQFIIDRSMEELEDDDED